MTTRKVLDDKYFGEGLSPRNKDEFLVLTWKERTVFRFNRSDLAQNQETFTLPESINEGWGITADESIVSDQGNYVLYISDGTDRIFKMDGDTFEVTKIINVRNEGGSPRNKVNELEYVDGFIYANIWYEDVIVKINANTGEIVKTWDISSLAAAERSFQMDQKN